MIKPRQNRLRPQPAIPAAPVKPSAVVVIPAFETPAGRAAARPPMAHFYSSAREGDLSGILGLAHYSYRFVEQKFLRLFADHGIALTKLLMPEAHSSIESLPASSGNAEAGMVHLVFRSTEEIRLLKLGYNICCFAWEFEVLKDTTRPGEHPFLNQQRMLSICDEVWAPCSYTRDVLERHGIENVHLIPAPITLPQNPRVSRYDALAAIGHLGTLPLITNSYRSREDVRAACTTRARSMIDWLAPRLAVGRDPLVYLAVLNPEDFRKNLDALLRGFHYFQQAHPDVFLIVKVLTGTQRLSLEQVIADVIHNRVDVNSVFDSDNIVFINRFLPDEEMSALYCIADFYLCTSVAEGQNLPLLEAMAHGTVPVTTGNTAMADYIRPDNAFLIDERLVDNTSPHMAGNIAGKPFRINFSTGRDVFAALERSRAASPAQRRQMAAAGIETVKKQYSVDVVWPLIAQRLAAIPRQLARAEAR